MRGGRLSKKIPGYTIALAAAASVFAFGGVETRGFAPVQVAIVLLAAYIFWHEGLPRLTRVTALVVLSLVAVPLLQLLPLPAGLVESLSALREPINAALAGAGVPPGATQTISIYPFETLMALLRLACYLLVFLLALRNGQQLQQQPGLVGLMVGLGIFEACYGILQYLTAFPYIFFYKKAAPAFVATGTYINRNHYAGLLEMCLPFLAARMLSRSGLHAHDGKTIWRRVLLAPQSSEFLRDALLFVTVLVGLIASLSRAGIGAGLVGIGVAAAVIFQRHRRSVMGVLGAILLLAAAYSLWIGIVPLLERVEELWAGGPDAKLRVAIWSDALRLIQDSPIFGTGLGTFLWSSMHYQSSLLSFRYEHAHNDILETAADCGIPVALVLWGALGVLLVRLLRKSARLRHTSDRVLAAGCAGAMTAMMLHSLADFNLQIPANALIFSWIVGAGAWLVQRRSHSAEHRDAAHVVIETSAESGIAASAD